MKAGGSECSEQYRVVSPGNTIANAELVTLFWPRVLQVRSAPSVRRGQAAAARYMIGAYARGSCRTHAARRATELRG